jgi:hypothetical protein
MASLISTTTPLAANGVFTSSVQNLSRAVGIVGSVLADQAGILSIEQSGDGTNWDIVQKFNVPANIGIPVSVPVVSQFFQVVYTNGSSAQTTFRLYIDIQDPYGNFLVASSGPSSGGAYAVLFEAANGWQYLGRYDGTDGWNACGNAAVSSGRGGNYASIPVTMLTVSNETLQTTTEHAPGTF